VPDDWDSHEAARIALERFLVESVPLMAFVSEPDVEQRLEADGEQS
jgi:hypothetical protein